MIEKKDLIFGAMGIFFALSGIFSMVSQSYDNKAITNLINPLLEFEKSNYISDQQIFIWELANSDSLSMNWKAIKASWFCSFASLYGGDPGHNQEILNSAIENCLKFDSNVSYYIESKDLTMNLTSKLKNISDSIKPIDSLSKSFTDFYDNRNKSQKWQYASWVALVIGFLVFYYYFIEYLVYKHLENKTRVQKAFKGELIK